MVVRVIMNDPTSSSVPSHMLSIRSTYPSSGPAYARFSYHFPAVRHLFDRLIDRLVTGPSMHKITTAIII